MSSLISSNERPGMRQLVDWSAAVWAGLIAGLAFILINVALIPWLEGGDSWTVVRYIASLVLGEGVLPSAATKLGILIPTTANLGILVVAILVNFVMSVVYALILAIIIHRGGLIMGIFSGVLFGLGIYLINVGPFALLYPWFGMLYSKVFIAAHIIFGALAGGIYEALEVEEFVPIEDA